MTALLPEFIAALIIPTGVGASVGGFAGDATPYLNLLASVTDVLITHPNVANAAVFQKLPGNALYVEGYGLDQFMLGRWNLMPVRQNRIGVVFDRRISTDMLTLHLNTINAAASVYGLDVVGYALTDAPVETGLEITASGCSSGYLKNPQTVLSACRHLQAQGATAIALCVQLPEVEDEETLEASYKAGSGVDPIGGIEGILSHLVVAQLGIPCAHAPVFPWEKARPVTDEVLDPRAAAEFIAPTFLPCVLTGLHRAPQFIPADGKATPAYAVQQVQALVVPANALGGLPVLAALERDIPVLAVEGNRTVLDVNADCFSTLPEAKRRLIRPVGSYKEAAGTLQMMRLGLRADFAPVRDMTPSTPAPLASA